VLVEDRPAVGTASAHGHEVTGVTGVVPGRVAGEKASGS
jgi:hypothetical protein